MKLLGLALAATGAAHFVAPDAFRSMTEKAFPEDTDAWIKRNGAAEVVVGLLIARRGTRKLGVLGLGAYGAHLASRASS